MLKLPIQEVCLVRQITRYCNLPEPDSDLWECGFTTGFGFRQEAL